MTPMSADLLTDCLTQLDRAHQNGVITDHSVVTMRTWLAESRYSEFAEPLADLIQRAKSDKDIWKSLPDAFASIANYLKKNGWETNQPWAIEVSTPANFDKSLMGRKVTKSVTEWENLGVVAKNRELPKKNYEASIVRPYGGPTYMIFNNFKVIMKWNRSIYYAGTVGYMAEKVCKRPL